MAKLADQRTVRALQSISLKLGARKQVAGILEL